MIEPIPEILANTTRVCEIRFDCLVQMHDVGFKKIQEQGFLQPEKRSKTPQWFRARHVITLETLKHADPYEIGMRIKQMYLQMEDTISKYEEYGEVRDK